jgi:hypothetical protein
MKYKLRTSYMTNEDTVPNLEIPSNAIAVTIVPEGRTYAKVWWLEPLNCVDRTDQKKGEQ